MGNICCCNGGSRSTYNERRRGIVKPIPDNAIMYQKARLVYKDDDIDSTEERDTVPELYQKSNTNQHIRPIHVFSDSESSGGEGFSENDDSDRDIRLNKSRASQQYLGKLTHTTFSDSESDDDQDTWEKRVNPEVDVRVPPGPVGLLLSREHERMSVVEGFCPLPDGSIGALERSNRVYPGSILCAINGMSVTNLPLEQVIHLLQKTSHVHRILSFRSSRFQYDDL